MGQSGTSDLGYANVPGMAALLNLLWLVFGGLFMGIGWFLAGLLVALTIVGLPWAGACFTLGQYTLWPFGREAVRRDALTGREDLGTGPLGLVGNVIWCVLLGLPLAAGHLIAALACAITIIGIPFAVIHGRLALVSLAPIGWEIVDRRVGDALRAAPWR